MSHLVDEILFKRLSDCSPIDVCSRTGCRYDQHQNSYYLSYWGDEYLVDLQDRKIIRLSSGFFEPHDYLPIFIVNYLMQMKKVPVTGEWISEKDLPGGVGFFRGPHEIPTHLVVSRFNDDLDQLARRCKRLGGKPLDMADAAHAFKPLPHVPIALLYWLGDEDFPSEAKLLFDKSLMGNLALDTVYALAVDVCSKISYS